ncbi:hypothetical protein KIH41_15000 [Litoribacter ruber]|uniref:Uncharacterized protein n=1 Tax=Litoribacter ruber TaxID=702568 RepID=A0AAP2CHI7_9BACT|nr:MULTISPECIES: hypothetical protein [Litoribacter]MBS9524823.1 hypothetical protein [Litoribacter alkaliphilus]MBT0812594.1 hypothetical protein [Litoribacter ruber]
MKNFKKIALVNFYALVTVVAIFAATKMLGMEFGFTASSLVPTVLLLVVPQAGFIYYLTKDYSPKRQEAIA